MPYYVQDSSETDNHYEFYEQELDVSLDQLMEAFDQQVSLIAAECTTIFPSRQLDALGSMKDTEETIYFVQMNEMSCSFSVRCYFILPY
jgi:hypothetical protein